MVVKRQIGACKALDLRKETASKSVQNRYTRTYTMFQCFEIKVFGSLEF